VSVTTGYHTNDNTLSLGYVAVNCGVSIQRNARKKVRKKVRDKRNERKKSTQQT